MIMIDNMIDLDYQIIIIIIYYHYLLSLSIIYVHIQ